MKFQKHISRIEIILAGAMYLLLLLAMITQLFFGGGALLILAALTIISVVYTYLVFWPECYEFKEHSFLLTNSKRERTLEIRYLDIIDFNTVGSFQLSQRDFDTVEVILTYRTGPKERKRTVSCHPKDIHGFVNMLQKQCPHLIDVFAFDQESPI